MGGGRLTRRKAVIGFLAVGALLEAAVAFAILAGHEGGATAATALPLHPVAGTFRPDGTRLENCADQTCKEQAFGNIAFRRGPKAALARFDAYYGDFSDPGCHRVAHAIGSASLARNKGDVAKTFAEGSASCFSGYYHGVLERSLLSVKSYGPNALGAVIRDLCAGAAMRSSMWLTGQCVHGLGHGLMITTGYDLPLSLKVCDRLRLRWERTGCNGGVFMENIASSYGFKSRWLRDDDPVYPCDWVPEEDKLKCYEIQTSRIVREVGGNWERTAEICSGVETHWVSACFRSFGRDVAGQAHEKPEAILEFCALARPYGGEAVCVTGAAMAMTGNFTSGKQAAGLCNMAPAAYRDGCYYGIGSVLVLFGSTTRERERDCHEATPVRRFVGQCVRGGSDYLRLGGDQWSNDRWMHALRSR
jgi:hypothetical protein